MRTHATGGSGGNTALPIINNGLATPDHFAELDAHNFAKNYAANGDGSMTAYAQRAWRARY
jgi:hypothetical protein